MKIDLDAHRRRRHDVMQRIAAAGGGVAVLPTAPERLRNRDSEYPYRSDSHFHYLCGFPEADAVLVLAVSNTEQRSVLFCRDKNGEREIWDGYRHGPAAAQHGFELDSAHALGELDARLVDWLANAPALYYPLGASEALDTQVQRWLAAVRAKHRSGVRAPSALIDLLPLIDELRLVKDAGEVATMRRAAQISAQAHARAMRSCQPGWREYQIEAELLHEFRRHGAQAPAYNPIVAAGANACVLHYRAGHAELRAGELCLIDAGCELDNYASDITRTFPVAGRFSGEQRAVYDIVLAAQLAAIELTRAGHSFNAPHEAAVRVLTQGLIDLDVLNGSVDGALEAGSYRQFYMHKTGHWLGLDVHDVGEYRIPGTQAADGHERPWRELVAGMVVTVEPGLYLRPAPNVPERFHHIGIRIEDDALVTAGAAEILSQAAPKAASEIEALMRA